MATAPAITDPAMATAARSLAEEFEMDEDSRWGYVKCPVCLELYTSKPKILPCAHLVCECCLISWVNTSAKPALCPVCRYNITDESICRLPSSMPAEKISEALPTDVTVVSMVKCLKVFEGPHTCVKCEAAANSFCMDCFVKFCKKCRRKHSKATNKIASKAAARLAGTGGAASPSSASAPAAESEEETTDPASYFSGVCVNSSVRYIPPKKHVIEMLTELTPKRILMNKRERCPSHQGFNFQDYYCTEHEVPVCLLCINPDHPSCKIITIEEQTEISRDMLREQSEILRKEEDRLKQEEEHIRIKEEEAKVMAETTRAEIDSAMDLIQFRLREEQARLKREVAEASDLPREQRVKRQADLIRAFSEKLKDIVSLKQAESALQKYEQFSREHVASITERAEALTGARLVQPRRVHHHNQRQPRHHHHRHTPPQPLSRTSLAAAEIRGEIDNLSSIVDEVTSDLENTVQEVNAMESRTTELRNQVDELMATRASSLPGADDESPPSAAGGQDTQESGVVPEDNE